MLPAAGQRAPVQRLAEQVAQAVGLLRVVKLLLDAAIKFGHA
jgi:hypothetical protein